MIDIKTENDRNNVVEWDSLGSIYYWKNKDEEMLKFLPHQLLRARDEVKRLKDDFAIPIVVVVLEKTSQDHIGAKSN